MNAESMSFPVLMYHRVVPGSRPDASRLAVDQVLFRDQMTALLERGYVCTSLSDLLGRIDAAQDVTRHVAVTFDDAYSDFGDFAWPVLRDLRCRATLYVPTAHVGGTADWLPGDGRSLPLLSWREIVDLRDDGVEIGSHGHVHRPLDEEPPEVVALDLERSRSTLRERVGTDVLTLAYPNGYASRTTRRIARAAGLASACVIGHSRQPVEGDRFAVRRLHVRGTHRPQDLLRLVEGRGAVIERAAKRTAETPWRFARRARAHARTLVRRNA
jgi:peptidoglycan/xylan/chitin deacetylase (PgdA/CDA1 family)